jgi:hypothetical protein
MLTATVAVVDSICDGAMDLMLGKEFVLLQG